MSQNSTMKLHDFYKIHTKLGPNEVILDVRNPDEYGEVKIKGSINRPLPNLAQHIDELRSYKRIYIHCKRGGRAKTAFDFLQKHGLTNVVCIDDAGIDLWVESDYPTE